MPITLAAYASTVTWGQPQTAGQLTLVPLFSAAQAPRRYHSLAEALEAGSLVIEEVGSGSVPELAVHNHGSWPVLLLDGEEVVGAKQNRVFNTTMLIPPHGTTHVPVSCVEQGRWHEASEQFATSANLMSPRQRGAKARSVSANLAHGGQRGSDQAGVWQGVAEQAGHFGVHSATGAMAEVFGAAEDRLAGVLAALPFGHHQKGFAAFVDGRLVGLEAVASSRIYSRVHAKLVRGYALEALQHPAAPSLGCECTAAARAFLEQVVASPVASYPAVGLGTELRLLGPGVTGSALLEEHAVVHLSALANHEAPPVPFARSYWVQPGRLLAGCYPGDQDRDARRRKLRGLVAAGVRCIISLMRPDETGYDGKPFTPYQQEVKQLAAEAGTTVRCLRYAVPDMTAPTPQAMAEILDAIDLALDAGEPVYVHCWGGRGRTGSVVGCWLARHGLATGETALRQVQLLRAADPTTHKPSPETEAQRALVRGWQE